MKHVITGKQEFSPYRDFRDHGLRYSLEHNTIFAITVFTLITMSICLVLLRYLGRKKAAKKQGKEAVKQEKSAEKQESPKREPGRSSVRLRLKR